MKTNAKHRKVPNHEYSLEKCSKYFLSSNRVRSRDEPSYTIVASSNSNPLHPQAPAMTKIKRGEYQLKKGSEHLYRRLSIRECARIQTFPDDFIFYYKNLEHGYRMVGNAVPVELAKQIAIQIQMQGCFKHSTYTNNKYPSFHF